MAMIGKVRRMFFREKKSVREIVRLTSLSRNTVRKWLKAAVVEEPKYQRGEAPGKLTPFHESIKQALKVDAHRPRHERRTARALHGQIQAEGYAGGYSRVTDFIRAWRQGEGQSIATTAFVPLAFELGEAFQFDWSEEGLVVGGIYYRMQVSHLKLCASRAFWLVAYPSQGHEMLFDAHTRSFAAMGGIARRGIYDFVPGNKIVDEPVGHAAEGGKRVLVTGQKELHLLRDREFQVHAPAVAQHHQEEAQAPARGAHSDGAVLAPVDLSAIAGGEVELEEGLLLARSDATHVHVDEGEAALVARLAQALEDLLGAIRMGIEPAHDLTLEWIELATARRTDARPVLLDGGPLGHRARVHRQRACGLNDSELLAPQMVSDLAEGLIVEHGVAPAVGATGPGSPGHRCQLLPVPPRLGVCAARRWCREVPAPGTAGPDRR